VKLHTRIACGAIPFRRVLLLFAPGLEPSKHEK
jgi:hypothetical protein